MYTCPHTAVALAVLEKLVGRGVIPKNERVVCVSTANGLKFTEFKVGYHDRTIAGVDSKLANPPVMLAPKYGEVMDAIAKRFG
jgi:threonine synthase